MWRIPVPIQASLDLFFPQACLGCGERDDGGRVLCDECDSRMGSRLRPFPSPERVRSAWALGPYRGPLGAMIRCAKYTPDGSAIEFLGSRLSEAAVGRLPPVDRVCHVPVPWTRRAVRGFDQAELLARRVAAAIDRPWSPLLQRLSGSEQAGRGRTERHQWARKAFRSRPITDARILLVDDVYTTGASASACAASLFEAGAQCVDFVCVARVERTAG
jgi:ComF family protein